MEKCLITKLQTTISDSNIPKLGEMRLTLTKRFNDGHVCRAIVGAITDNVIIKIISGGYFCKSYTDTTPLNDIIEDSKQINVVNSTKIDNSDDTVSLSAISVYFQSEEIVMYINDKYNFLGFGINPTIGINSNILKYYLKNLKYLPNWTQFSVSDEKIKVQDIPSKTITSCYYNTDGNFEGITLGALSNVTKSDNKRAFVFENNVTGTIKAIKNQVYTYIVGTFTLNITNINNCEGIILVSPNVYGDITSFLGEEVYLGDTDIYTNITCNSPLSTKVATRYITLFSNILTVEMLGNLLNVPSKCNYTINSKQFTVDEISSNTSIMEKITNCKNLGATVKINNHTF